MDLTFQVPMQYCSLQHRTLLSPPDTTTTGHCFCCGSASSFLLELVLHSSPVAYWAPTDWGVHFSGLHVLPFLTVYYIYVAVVQSLSSVCLCDPRVCSPSGSSVHRILQASILEWAAISSSRICMLLTYI